MKIYRWALFVMLVMLILGCLPIELDVSGDGRVLIPRQEGFFSLDTQKGTLTKLYTPKTGVPVFARYAPDGKSLLAVVNIEGSFSFRLVGIADGTEKEMFNAGNALYTRFSPDGRFIAISRVADGQKPPIDENMPELHLIQTGDAMGKVVAYNVSSQHRWTPDAKHLLVFQILKKDDKRRYYGNLVLVNAVSGEKKALAAAVGPSNVFFDLSPDGRKVLLTAFAAGPPNADLKPGDEDKATIFEVDVEKAVVRKTDKATDFAIWAPDGRHILLSGGDKGGNRVLEVADAGLTKFTTVASDAAGKTNSAMGDETTIYPGWINGQTLFYLARRSVYGSSGVNLTFVTVRTDGQGRKNLQTLIDQEVMKYDGP